jgi:hypothetical protein
MIPNPTYEEWYATDQQVLAYLLLSLSKDIMAQVMVCTTAASTWVIIEGMFTSGTCARSVNIRISLATMKKYVSKARTLADEMAIADKKIDDEELISYILVRLDYEYNSVVSTLVARPDAISIGEVYSQLLSYEQRVEQQAKIEQGYQASANAASRGRGAVHGRMGLRRGRSPSRGRGRHQGRSGQNPGNTYGRGNNSSATDTRPRCQVCFKKGHMVDECWHRFDDTYVLEERYAGAAFMPQANDSSWYLNTGATDHVTGELEKLAIHEKYKGKDQIHGADDGGMKINHIGQAVINTPNHQFTLKNVLHVPKAYKNLVSVYRLTKDNSVFLEIHPAFFLVKDQVLKRIILSGRSHHGLYPIPAPSSIKQLLSVIRPSLEQWHSCFGHPSYSVVAQVVSDFKLPVF